MSFPPEAISAILSAVGADLVIFGIALLFLPGGFPGRHQIVELPLDVMPDLEDDRTEEDLVKSSLVASRLTPLPALLRNSYVTSPGTTRFWKKGSH